MIKVVISIPLEKKAHYEHTLFALIARVLDDKKFQRYLWRLRNRWCNAFHFGDFKYRLPINYDFYDSWLSEISVDTYTKSERLLRQTMFKSQNSVLRSFKEPPHDILVTIPEIRSSKSNKMVTQTGQSGQPKKELDINLLGIYFFYRSIIKVRKILGLVSNFDRILAKAVVCNEVRKEDFDNVRVNTDFYSKFLYELFEDTYFLPDDTILKIYPFVSDNELPKFMRDSKWSQSYTELSSHATVNISLNRNTWWDLKSISKYNLAKKSISDQTLLNNQLHTIDKRIENYENILSVPIYNL